MKKQPPTDRIFPILLLPTSDLRFVVRDLVLPKVARSRSKRALHQPRGAVDLRGRQRGNLGFGQCSFVDPNLVQRHSPDPQSSRKPISGETPRWGCQESGRVQAAGRRHPPYRSRKTRLPRPDRDDLRRHRSRPSALHRVQSQDRPPHRALYREAVRLHSEVQRAGRGEAPRLGKTRRALNPESGLMVT